MDVFDFTNNDALFDFAGNAGPNGPPPPPAASAPGPAQPLFVHANDPRNLVFTSLGESVRQDEPSPWQSLGSTNGTDASTHLHRSAGFRSVDGREQQQQQQSQIPDLHHSFHHDQPLLARYQAQRQGSRPGSNCAHHPTPLQRSAFGVDYNSFLNAEWQYRLTQSAFHQQAQNDHRATQAQPFPSHGPMHMVAGYRPQLQASPVDFLTTTAAVTAADSYGIAADVDPTSFVAMARPMSSMHGLAYPIADYRTDIAFPMALNTATLTEHLLSQQATEPSHAAAAAAVASSHHSPGDTSIDVQSVSDNEWSMVNVNPNRHSIESCATVSNPSQNLHIRTNSDSSSDGANSTGLSGSYEEISPWPATSPHDLHGSDYLDAQYIQQQTRALPIPTRPPNSPSSMAVSPSGWAGPSYHSSGSSSSTSPTSSSPLSPPLRRRKSPPSSKTTKPTIKKASQAQRKDGSGSGSSSSSSITTTATTEKKVGRRRGPLRPDQRQQAHEIRKLRACLRCKFLKKTCDKGEPCAGCKPSHARLWQVPCTRMDIKGIAFFMKDWKADYERHVSLGFSVGNIRGFSNIEHTLYITHGYGHYLPINAREVFVRDDKCFGIDWVESIHESPRAFEVNTAKLSAGIEGVSTTLLSEYLDRHLDCTFESFVDEFFEGTFFVTEILKTAHRYYLKEKTPSIRKALKLVLAYNLTQHVTMIEPPGEDQFIFGKIERGSRFAGMAAAPVMINFQVKCALADMWRELQKDILEELSSLYSSVYSGDKLKNWPTIFMLAAILLAIWEEMQFDCHYRVLDEKVVEKFCDDMESTPVGVIVGLFQAISTKLPGLQEWDTRKHHHLLGSNQAVCDALTEVKEHIDRYEKYLRERSSAKFDREDFECLSNKFLSKLVIRAN